MMNNVYDKVISDGDVSERAFINTLLFEVEHAKIGTRDEDLAEWAQWQIERVAATLRVISNALGGVPRTTSGSVLDVDLEACLSLLEGKLRASSKALDAIGRVKHLKEEYD